MKKLLGRKIGMTQIFNDAGDEIPVTLLEVGPCPVVAIIESGDPLKKRAKIAFDPITKKDKNKVSKPKRGLFEKANLQAHRFVREVELDSSDADIKVGDYLKVDIFKDVHYVNLSGVSKGKGYQGVMKRYGFKGSQTLSHGTHEFKRHGGSIGMREWPGRVMKGRKMAGQMGNKKVTVLNLEVVRLFEEENLLLVRGATPGANGSLVNISVSDRKVKVERAVAAAKFINPLKMSKKSVKKK